MRLPEPASATSLDGNSRDGSQDRTTPAREGARRTGWAWVLAAVPARAWPAVLGAMLAVAIAATVTVHAMHRREAAIAVAEREAGDLSLALARWVEAGFGSIESLQQGMVAWVGEEGAADPGRFARRLAGRDAHELLRARIAALPRVRRADIADAEGRIVASTERWPAPEASLGGREIFEALRGTTGSGTVFGRPERDPGAARWTVDVARRIEAPDGTFLGAIASPIDTAYFERIFQALSLAPDSSVSLVRRDGTVIARHPRIERVIGSSLAGSPSYRDLLRTGSSGVTRGRSLLDGKDRIFAVRTFDAHPLAVIATQSMEVLLAPWRRETLRDLLIAGLLEGGILAAVLLARFRGWKLGLLRRMRAAHAEAEARLSVSLERERSACSLAEREAALRAIFDISTVGIAETDLTTQRYIRVNRRYCEMTGRSEAELYALGPMDFVYPEDRAALRARWQAALTAGEVLDEEVRRIGPDGAERWVLVSVATSARDAQGRPLRCVAIAQDITERRQAAERLRRSETMTRLSLEIGRIGIFSRDLGTGAISCGPETRILHGFPVGDGPIPERAWLELLLPEDRARMQQEIRAAIAAGATESSFTYRFRHPAGGKVRHIEARARYEFDAEGRAVSSIGVIIDVTESRETEALLQLALAAGRIGTFRRDFAAGTMHCSAETRAMFGLPHGHAPIPYGDWADAVLPEDRERHRNEIGALLAHRERDGVVHMRVRARDGSVRHVETRAHIDYDALGRPAGVLGVVIDNTERREAEARITYLAHHDALTDLPNRVMFRQRLDAALERAHHGERFALLCLDLDRFKEVNDALGHPVGDALLRAVTERLRGELRGTDILARLGGDEFAVIQASLDQPRDATALARRLIDVLAAPFDVGAHQVTIGTSIGIAIGPDDGCDGDLLLKGADLALYRAKAEGRRRWSFFEPEMDARMQLRRALEVDLSRALATGEFALFYQPIVSIASRRVVGLEALLRWQHPERGSVPPDVFIPLAEETGLIVALGEWVLMQACGEAVAWQGAPRVAVNLSPVQFASRSLVEVVTAALARSGLPADRLELEITETVLLQDSAATLDTLRRLKSIGVRIALDDFGTGYSSLSYLQRFPFDKVKVDRCFTKDLGRSPNSDAIVRAVVDLCDGLGMTTTAEGVETEAQFEALSRRGCQEAQGYLFSRPCPAGDIPDLLERLGAAAQREAEAA